MIVTLAERKQQALARLRAADALVRQALASHALARHGRFVVFGSFARGDIGPQSDFDVMLDFPTDIERTARHLVEATCRAHGLVADVHLKSEVPDALMRRVVRDGVTLS